jgi:hypothetical protein
MFLYNMFMPPEWKNGMLEYWEQSPKQTIFIVNKLLQTHHSITPLFHPSNGDLPLRSPSRFTFLVLAGGVKRTHLIYTGRFPQQLPGPAQSAWPGDKPQQAVSPGPGIRFLFGPDREEWAERSFFRLWPPQVLHLGLSSEPAMRSSLVSPQSIHKKSKRGILLFSLAPKSVNIPVFQFRSQAQQNSMRYDPRG